MTTRVPVGLFFALFTVSGFAGLIYESIWSHYLKLFLGHAAYAQTLVLAIFMGGMALGSWLVSRFTGRIRNLLLGYAMAELAIGLLAILFDGIFRVTTAWAFDSIFPMLGSGLGIDLFKWTLAALLILPASTLLGTTFPLMSGGLIRLYPGSGGRALSMLYFTNSLGAAAGVLASGFFLIDLVGLPGTILTAGLMNVALAGVVWALAKRIPESTAAAVIETAPQSPPAKRLYRTILTVALVTGAASFVYEIAWIRMLTLGLGASSHSFEVMLAAFIFGMSLGAWLLRNHVPAPGRDLAWLAVLLALKAAFAVYAIGIYDDVLGLVEFAMGATSRTPGGYAVVTFMGFVASATLMLPTAICAGMTLPLATNALTARGYGEASIGKVYAFNTAGCIVGAVFATHVGMVAFGVHGLTAAGAVLDFLLAVTVVVLMAPARRMAWAGALALLLVAGIAAVVAIKPDELRMASGVFRYGKFLDPLGAKVEFYRDGKTATVSMTRQGSGMSIRTNGKPDAAVEMDDKEPPAPDQSTMVLLGALPLSIRPDAESAAVIGFGAGISTHALLGSPRIKSVDTIEIEPAMVEAARLYRPRNERAYADPRSHVTIEDAKTFFATRGAKYDLILSEPSNPWVSGVATLFSQEFYAQVSRYLKPRGLFVQWLQQYEINVDLAATVFQALGSQFSDYRVFRTHANDLVIVAVKEGRVPEIDGAVFGFPGLRADLERLGLTSVEDLRATDLGSRASLQPLFDGHVSNSDYFPVLEQRAPLARFMGENLIEIAWLPMQYVPVLALRERDMRVTRAALRQGLGPRHPLRSYAQLGAEALDLMLQGAAPAPARLAADSRAVFRTAHDGLRNCALDRDEWFRSLDEGLQLVIARLAREEGALALAAIERSPCAANLTADQRSQLELHRAVNERDTRRMTQFAIALLGAPIRRDADLASRLVLSAMVGKMAADPGTGALEIWRAFASRLPDPQKKQIVARLVVAQAVRQAVDASQPPAADAR